MEALAKHIIYFEEKKDKIRSSKLRKILAEVTANMEKCRRKNHGRLFFMMDTDGNFLKMDSQGNPQILDTIPSATSIQALFYKGAPMHDGAVIIRNNRIAAAGCMLPNTTDTSISQELGARHRAALGMSEVSDAVIVVVSEETGTISIACDSVMTREYSIQGLKLALTEKLVRKRDRKDEGVDSAEEAQ